jgi:hypothetical protein
MGGSTGAPSGGEDNPGGEGDGTPPSDANADSDAEDDDAADDDESDDDEESDPAKGRKGKPASKRKGAEDDADDGDFVRLPKSEMQRLRREARDAQRKLSQHATEERARREKDMADQEKWKDLADSREERITELEGELEALRMEGTKNERKATVVKVAKRLNFEYPEDAHLFLEADDMEDERSVESALKTVLRDRPKLKSRSRRSGAPIPGESETDGKDGQLTREQIEKMSPEEINKNWPAVQAFLRSQEVAAS